MHACIHTWLPTYVHTYLHSYRHTHENIHVDLCWFIYVCILRHHLKWCFFFLISMSPRCNCLTKLWCPFPVPNFLVGNPLVGVFNIRSLGLGSRRWPHRLHRPHLSFVISLNAELRGDVSSLVHVELPQQIRSEGLWILEKKGRNSKL